ncbi:hypothetical protein E5676_scaffold994G00290 [Cucumis melo var. makuwa]|uniref:Uncharacterized protein n=1 Tax=Cucumis melo var. makuwa TaxID=1194695 RepID=A0A5D3CE99_CUCMM|nr:hypothetical protein E6C27_scaffold712G00020 [Cucumis melo var. makuwa]TYK09524.1 hypothetical protein E5676_scaffold994G00290 [Cucumis melo var. makuwa]
MLEVGESMKGHLRLTVEKLDREEGKGLGLPIPIEPHKGKGAVERFHIAELKSNTSLRDRSISPPLIPAAFHSIYTLFLVH